MSKCLVKIGEAARLLGASPVSFYLRAKPGGRIRYYAISDLMGNPIPANHQLFVTRMYQATIKEKIWCVGNKCLSLIAPPGAFVVQP